MTEEELLYSPGDNLWLREEDGNVLVGIAGSMLAILGKPEYVNLPAAGTAIAPGVPFGTLENAKSAFDLALPFPCRVISSNQELDLAALGAAPDGELPLVTVRPDTVRWTDGLLDAQGYAAFVAP